MLTSLVMTPTDLFSRLQRESNRLAQALDAERERRLTENQRWFEYAASLECELSALRAPAYVLPRVSLDISAIEGGLCAGEVAE